MQNLSNGSSTSLEEAYNYENGIPIVFYFCYWLMSAIGSIGNLHVLIVYSVKYDVSVYKTFVLCLSAVDFLACTFCIPAILYSNTVHSLCKVSSAATHFVGMCSLALLDVIVMERYRKVCQVTRAQFTVCSARTVCAGVMVFSFMVTSIPIFLFYGAKSKLRQHGSQVGSRCLVSDKYTDSMAIKIHRGVLFLIYIILLIVCVVLYSMVVKTIYGRQKRQQKPRLDKSASISCSSTPTQNQEDEKSSRLRHDSKQGAEMSSNTLITLSGIADHNTMANIMTNQSQITEESVQISTGEKDDKTHPATEAFILRNTKDSALVTKPSSIRLNSKRIKKINRSRNITMMFLLVSLISFGGYIPYLILRLIQSADKKLKSTNELYLSLSLLTFLNNVINPLVYGFMDKKFRKELLSLYKDVKTWACST